MRYGTYIYKFGKKIHYLCFIVLILTYVQAQDVGAPICPEGIARKYGILGRCFNSTHPDCKVNNCHCGVSNDGSSWSNFCYCCKVKS
uniref:S-locus pollen protein 11-3 n=2 Tax=Raphanus sativus TaxID=3726 RepID=Q6TGF3_RAPSA|nr:S-locus pollen protein 11-3 [Raphanus sativus]